MFFVHPLKATSNFLNNKSHGSMGKHGARWGTPMDLSGEKLALPWRMKHRGFFEIYSKFM